LPSPCIYTGLFNQLDNNAADTDLTHEGRGLARAYTSEAFTQSQDGNYLYFASVNSHAITVLKRNVNGIIGEAQYIKPLTKNLPSQANEYPQSITISPDQRIFIWDLKPVKAPPREPSFIFRGTRQQVRSPTSTRLTEDALAVYVIDDGAESTTWPF